MSNLVDLLSKTQHICCNLHSDQKFSGPQLNCLLAVIEPLEKHNPLNLSLFINWISKNIAPEDTLALARTHIEVVGKNLRREENMSDTLNKLSDKAKNYCNAAPDNLKVRMMETLVSAFAKNGHYYQAAHMPYYCFLETPTPSQKAVVAKAGAEILAKEIHIKAARQFIGFCTNNFSKKFPNNRDSLCAALGTIKLEEPAVDTTPLESALQNFIGSLSSHKVVLG